MTIVLLVAIAGLWLWIADAAIGRPDRLARHTTAAEALAARITPGRLALTVLVAAALPLAGLAQVLKATADLAGHLHAPVAVPA